ncbi:hypothetical protein SUDANB54_03513 [Streptomyces sp. enrichment culture]
MAPVWLAARVMADTTRVTVTLPSEQVAELRKLTDNVSGYVAEAVTLQVGTNCSVPTCSVTRRSTGPSPRRS